MLKPSCIVKWYAASVKARPREHESKKQNTTNWFKTEDSFELYFCFIYSETRKELGLEKEDIVIGYAANLTMQKGVTDFLEAAIRLIKNSNN